MQSSLNEVGKSEQKGNDLDKKRNLDYRNGRVFFFIYNYIL